MVKNTMKKETEFKDWKELSQACKDATDFMNMFRKKYKCWNYLTISHYFHDEKEIYKVDLTAVDRRSGKVEAHYYDDDGKYQSKKICLKEWFAK